MGNHESAETQQLLIDAAAGNINSKVTTSGEDTHGEEYTIEGNDLVMDSSSFRLKKQ